MSLNASFSFFGQALLPALDPLSPSPEGDQPPRFSAPVSVAADLPGGLFYYRVSKPIDGVTSYSATLAHPDFGSELVTDSFIQVNTLYR